MKTALMIHHSDDTSTSPQFDKVFDYHNRGAPKPDGTLKWPAGHGIQYHFFIEHNGELRNGKSMMETAWHSNDTYWNENALAVCLAGDFTKQTPTEAQLAALFFLWKYLDFPSLMLHKEVRATSCPGTFDFKAELRRRYIPDLKQRLRDALHALPRFLGTMRGNMLSRLIERLRNTKGVDDGGE